jgi:hypothetical protein
MSAQAPPYRNADDEVARHAKRLLASHRQVDDKKLRALYQSRCARIGFGYVGSMAAICALIAIAFADTGQIQILASAWAAAFAGGLIAYLGAHLDLARRAKKSAISAKDPYSLVIQLTNPIARDVRDDYLLNRIERLGLESHRYPLLVGAMLLPLTLIIGFFVVSEGIWADMGELATIALVYTAHVHLYAMIAAWRFPKSRRAGRTIAIATMLGVLPFIISAIFVGIIAATITLCFFIPLSYWVDRENAWIAQEKAERRAARRDLEERARPATRPFHAGTFYNLKNTAAEASPL